MYQSAFDPRKKYAPLAKWLKRLMEGISAQSDSNASIDDDTEFFANYHPHFYQQLPDFIMALLKKEADVVVKYAPLLYHLAGCATCRQAYVELYDAMKAAVEPDGSHVSEMTGVHTLDTTPPNMLMLLCQLLIGQAEAVKRQARRDHMDNDDLVRLLLQQALQVSKHLRQDNMRHKATQDLVRVATLFEEPVDSGPVIGSFTPQPVGGVGMRRAKSVVRKAGATAHPSEQQAIFLHFNKFEIIITQEGDTLELTLHHLDKQLSGHYLLIDIPLGALIEPLRWHGGNPRSIRSVIAVDEHGTLKTPLGETELKLSEPEDYNLLETIFSRLEVRKAE
jgi:hypothetical protein